MEHSLKQHIISSLQCQQFDLNLKSDLKSNQINTFLNWNFYFSHFEESMKGVFLKAGNTTYRCLRFCKLLCKETLLFFGGPFMFKCIISVESRWASFWVYRLSVALEEKHTPRSEDGNCCIEDHYLEQVGDLWDSRVVGSDITGK